MILLGCAAWRQIGRGADMTRRDVYLDGMLRHLGAAYYESLHGRATAADVARAIDSVEDHTGDHGSKPAGPHAAAASSATGGTQARGQGKQHHGRWHHRVRDVMTTSVLTVDRITPYKEIATLMAEHKVSAVPVLTMGRHVAGVVSEADLLGVQDKRARRARLEPGGRLHLHAAKKEHWGLTAAELMTSPAITIYPDATLPATARLMNSRHLKRLPVVDADGTLIGIVSRCDLLSVFLRPDEDIAREVREMLTQILLTDPATITARVHNGIVTLAGQPGPSDQHDLIPVAVRLTWDIDGVVDVVNKLGATAPA
jgi:CBS-domain-containing membrane protein